MGSGGVRGEKCEGASAFVGHGAQMPLDLNDMGGGRYYVVLCHPAVVTKRVVHTRVCIACKFIFSIG